MFQYSFGSVDLIIRNLDFPGSKADNAVVVTGFPTGDSLITAARRAPVGSVDFGAYGEMVASIHMITAGNLSFPLLAMVELNEHLQAWVNYFQEQGKKGGGRLVKGLGASIVDNMGNDLVECSGGIILEVPALVRGQERPVNNWNLVFEKMKIVRGTGADSNDNNAGS